MRLIRGAPGSGKTALVFHEYAQALKEGRESVRIVVPTATLVRHYRHELVRAGLVIQPRTVVSLSKLAQEHAPNLRLVSTGLLRALIRGALTRLNLSAFSGVAETQGMADVVLETIGQFENAGCTPARLARVRSLTSRGKAFLRVWTEVEAAVAARGFATRGAVLRAAAESAGQGGIFFFDGFLSFSPLERTLIEALDQQNEVALTLTDSPITDDVRRFAMSRGAADRLLPGRARNPKTIVVIAPSPEREADEIARRILELNACGTPFHQVAIALRDVDTWLPLLRTTFNRFGIPARYYFSRSLRHHPVTAFLGGIIACALNGWDYADTIKALRAHPAWGHTADFDRFDFQVREAMPGRGAARLLALCDSEWLRSRISDCAKVEAWVSQKARPATWQRRLQDFAASVYRVRTISEPNNYAAVETARTHTAALRSWSGALETATCLWPPDAEVSLADFHTALLEELDSAAMSMPDDRGNTVHVMSAFEARQWEVSALIVCGMNARDYPRRHPQNLLFSDAEIAPLRGQGIPLRTATDEDRDEEFLFESLKSRAKDNLILTVAARSSGGQSVEPSRFLAEVAAAENARQCRPALSHFPAAPGIAGSLSEASLPVLAEQHRTIGITAFERLAKCRFLFFADRTLKLKEAPKRPADRLNPRFIGIVFHSAMEEWLKDKTRNFVDVFEHAFSEGCRKDNIPPGYDLEVQRIVARRIAAEVNEIGRWPAESTETEVDCTIDFPGGVTAVGRLDRIDHLGNGDCIIVDYKSGKVKNVDKLVESETSLQGQLYALSVREKRGLNPVAMVFLAIREGGKTIGWGSIPGASLELLDMPADWIDSARDRIVARLQSFLAGDIHAEPHTPDDCIWCDYRNTCRIEEQQTGDLIHIGVAGA